MIPIAIADIIEVALFSLIPHIPIIPKFTSNGNAFGMIPTSPTWYDLNTKKNIPKMIREAETEMKIAADRLDFERAIYLRERIKELKKRVSTWLLVNE